MALPNRFKRWYSVTEAAAALAKFFDEPVTQEDVLEQVSSEGLSAYICVDGRYGVPVNPGCHFYPNAEHPALLFLKDLDFTPQGDLRRGPEDLLETDGVVRVLSGYFKLMMGDRFDYFFVPESEERGRYEYMHGMLAIDPSDDTIYKLLKRWPDSPAFSMEREHFTNQDPLPPVERVLIAASDLRSFLASESVSDQAPEAASEALGGKEKASLQKQVAVIALALAEKSNAYRKGDKPNALQIARTVSEILAALPDANVRGVSESSLRASIQAGLEHLRT